MSAFKYKDYPPSQTQVNVLYYLNQNYSSTWHKMRVKFNQQEIKVPIKIKRREFFPDKRNPITEQLINLQDIAQREKNSKD